MRLTLIITAAILFAACNHNKHTKHEITEDSISTSTDSVVAQPPAGKIDIERLGPLKIGQTEADLIAALGQPQIKSPAVEWAADGLLHEQWNYDAKGLVIGLSSEKPVRENSRIVFSITATAPCTYKTLANVGVGSAYADISNAYKRDIDSSASNPEQIVVGSLYGGIVFLFKGTTATSVFLGAIAE